MNHHLNFQQPAVRIWIVAGSIFTLAGWGLSLIGQLNSTGYLLTVVAITLFLIFCGFRFSPTVFGRGIRKRTNRFRRTFPRLFLIAAALVFIGGIIYPPNNYDALSYRIPRILNWLAENHWYWIHSQDARMNIRACGTEWLITPLIALNHSDRWVFFVNASCFLLLPGLIFSTFSRLGVRRRVAWAWMWLLPSGYTFLLQAGGNANDLIGVFLALSAMNFALRSMQSRRIEDVWLAILAGALLTGCKTSNLPLLLPIGLALLPGLKALASRPLSSLGILATALAVSFLPLSLLNIPHVGDWTGYAIESSGTPTEESATSIPSQPAVPTAPETYVFMAKSPVVGILGNTAMLMVENLVPPIFPWATWWNSHVSQESFKRFPTLKENFAPSFLTQRELQGEENAGLGFGLSWLLLGTIFCAFLLRKEAFLPRTEKRDYFRLLILISPWISLLAYMMKSGITCPSRILAPYYCLLLPLLIVGRAHGVIVRTRWWKRAAIAVYLIALGVLIVAPERPLWPVESTLAAVEKKLGHVPAIQRAARVYAVYRNRYDALAPVKALLPSNLTVIGFNCNFDQAGASLWRPIGSTRVRQVLMADSRDQLEKWHVQYIVAIDRGPDLPSWLERIQADKVAEQDIQFFASQPPVRWHVIKLR